MRLSIIIVNTNESKVLRPCLTSIFNETKGLDFEVIVIDNASADDSLMMLANHFAQVKVINNSENLGFAAANNRGILEARGDYILLLNPDTIVRDRAIQKTLAFMDLHPQVGIAGCKLLFPDGSLQRSARSFPTLWNVFCEVSFLYRLFPRSKLFGKYYLSYFDYDLEKEVDWLCGAFFMIRRGTYEKIGVLDEQFYMYTEEVDYCYRAKLAGDETWFVPEAEIVHFFGGVNATSRRVVLWTNASQILYFQKYFRGVQLYTLIFLKYLGIAVRIFVYVIAGLFLLNKKMFIKSYYALFALYYLCVDRWRYRHNFIGKVIPWKPV